MSSPLKKGCFSFHMYRQNCVRLAQMFYDEKRMSVEELEDLFDGKVKDIIDGKLQWENWGRMIRLRSEEELNEFAS